METFTRLNLAAQFILSQFPQDLSLATPLGLGKPNQLINLLYQSFKVDKSRHLKIFTALSLDIPIPKKDLERRFADEFLARHFGTDYPVLDYVRDAKGKKLPVNISVEEFYFQAGQHLGNSEMQANYNSLNYTHVARSLYNSGIDVIIQMIAVSKDGQSYSLSCNPDLTLDLVELHRTSDKPLMMVGVVHPDLPFLGGDAVVPKDFFQVLIESPEVTHTLFSPPKGSLSPEEKLIGLHASQLLQDDGTLQIGIGALSDACVHATILRHNSNPLYRKLLDSWSQQKISGIAVDHSVFSAGLYGTSEMIMDGFMHLRRAGILKREVMDQAGPEKKYLHGAFFLGSKEFYQWLRDLSELDFAGLSMTRVSKVNDLYDANEKALRRQRKKARFLNTCMNVTMLGAAASETLEDGQVISGVGGQYNFVAMSQELPDSHSILMLRSTRTSKNRRKSNLVWSHGQLTIPRHLRDVVVTEYGIAALKGQNDETVIQRLLNVADSEFQPELLAIAKKSGKLRADYQIPNWALDNTPARVARFFASPGAKETFPDFPFGSDFTPAEEKLQKALMNLKEASAKSLGRSLWKGLTSSERSFSEELQRMGYTQEDSGGLKSWFYRKLLLGALSVSKERP